MKIAIIPGTGFLARNLARRLPTNNPIPSALAQRIGFTLEPVREGLPAPGPFGWRDLRGCRYSSFNLERKRSKWVFFEMP